MRVLNTHERTYSASPETVGRFLDGLGSIDDRIWPRDAWPPMQLSPAVSVGAAGGHGPIRYSVEEYEPRERVVFRFTYPRGWAGTHGFVVQPVDRGGARLVHLLEIEAKGLDALRWLLVFRPLHDAVIEDAFDRVCRELGEACEPRRNWSGYVRFLRWLLRPRSAGRRSRRAT